MARCPRYDCNVHALDGDPDGLCLLHSRQEDKDPRKFKDAVDKKLEAEDYDFRSVYFPGNADFSGWEFTKDTHFLGATFAGWADFSKATFSGKADFFKATFSGGAVFTTTTFLGGADFSVATFIGAVSFIDATFIAAATFFTTNFSGNARFSKATFSGKAGFSGATFLGEADFSESTFSAADFSRAAFSGAAAFSKATFSGAADFSLAAFLEGADFHGSAVAAGGRLLLLGINPPDEGKHSKPFKAEFRSLIQEVEGRIIFQDLSLAHATLTGTDLRLCRFHNVDWHPFHGRQALSDEILLYEKYKSQKEEKPSKEQYARVEESYRYLKLNHESAGDFKKVGDFHFGEMEMHRRASPWRRFCSLYSAYWALSGYGERPLRAFIWLLLLIPILAGLVWGLGIDQAGLKTPINYGDTLLFIFEKVTFQRPALPAGLTWLGKFLSGLSVLLIPGQAALFILALRNRLGRRR